MAHAHNPCALLRLHADTIEALQLTRRALRIHAATLGDHHPTTLEARTALAQLLHSTGSPAGAECEYRRCLAAAEAGAAATGSPNPCTPALLMALVNVLREQGKMAEAEAPLRAALALCERARGPCAGDGLHLATCLAGLLRELGRHAEAERAYRRCLALHEQRCRAGGSAAVSGGDHQRLAHLLGGLANVLMPQGKLADAEALHRRALDLLERQLLPPPLMTLHGHSDDSAGDGASDDGDGGGTARGRSGVIGGGASERQRQLDIAHSLHNLALVLLKRGRPLQAEPLCRRALSICGRMLDGGHAHTSSCRKLLAGILRDQEAQAAAAAAAAAAFHGGGSGGGSNRSGSGGVAPMPGREVLQRLPSGELRVLLEQRGMHCGARLGHSKMVELLFSRQWWAD